MQIKTSVIAVVVTFNRKALLAQCLQGLLAQTSPLAEIIIVDNASTDDTEVFVRDFLNQKDSTPFPISYYRLPQNIGGAGGFYEGMRLASTRNPSWIWTMDDDVFAAPDALAQLLKYSHLSECIHPRRILPDGQEYPWEQIFEPTTTIKTPLNDVSFRNGKAFCFSRVACFEGMLISATLVKKIGLPQRCFFLIDDDTLYGYLASLHTNVIYTRDGTLHKLIHPSRLLSPNKLFYAARNKIWLHKSLRSYRLIPPKSWFQFYLYYAMYIVLTLATHPNLKSIASVTRGACAGLLSNPPLDQPRATLDETAIRHKTDSTHY
jgi:GT2 family glycosyltransferase